MNNEADNSKELRILRVLKRVLTDVAKDTHTQAGLKHPLSETTINGIRDGLALITSRESEIQSNEPNHRPHFINEPQDKVVVSLKPSKSKTPKK